MNLFSDLLWILFPELCASCGKALYSGEDVVCSYCRLHLPKTNFHLEKENPVAKQFWGKVNVHAAAAYYYFSKGEKVQHLVHQLKYKGNREVGNFVGELYGTELKQSELFAHAEIVIPVPLHASKLRKRGFNQSDFFAEGLAKAMEIPFSADALKKNLATETQTRKHRYERFENVDRVFEVNKPELVSGKHVLLADDVVTTGSTLTSCAEALLEIPGTTVSIVTMAYA
ncbi:MAG: ComF family protein [Bacteroidetes bacterium]|nr:ComF family protein [Bacteroidota bacterium]